MFKNLNELSEREHEIIHECLKAAQMEEFFPSWEFETLFGFPREYLNVTIKNWLNGQCSHEDKKIVRQVLNQLLGYPHGMDKEWGSYISAPFQELLVILEKFKLLTRDTTQS
jgi:hypothetical protein